MIPLIFILLPFLVSGELTQVFYYTNEKCEGEYAEEIQVDSGSCGNFHNEFSVIVECDYYGNMVARFCKGGICKEDCLSTHTTKNSCVENQHGKSLKIRGCVDWAEITLYSSIGIGGFCVCCCVLCSFLLCFCVCIFCGNRSDKYQRI